MSLPVFFDSYEPKTDDVTNLAMAVEDSGTVTAGPITIQWIKSTMGDHPNTISIRVGYIYCPDERSTNEHVDQAKAYLKALRLQVVLVQYKNDVVQGWLGQPKDDWLESKTEDNRYVIYAPAKVGTTAKLFGQGGFSLRRGGCDMTLIYSPFGRTGAMYQKCFYCGPEEGKPPTGESDGRDKDGNSLYSCDDYDIFGIGGELISAGTTVGGGGSLWEMKRRILQVEAQQGSRDLVARRAFNALLRR